MLFRKKNKIPENEAREDPKIRRELEIERLEDEREALNAEIELLVKEYSSAIGSRGPVKGTKPMGTQPNEWSFWHKKRRL